MPAARVVQALFVTATLALCDHAHAHARLTSPMPRNNQANLKVGPCGGIAPTGAFTAFAPGETITVKWEETIAHPGYYRIAFSPGMDQGFDQHVLADQLPNPSGVQSGQAQVTLPDLECTQCTLQLIQVMTESNPPSNYYSCADLTLTAPQMDAGVPSQDAGTSVDAGGEAPGEDAGVEPSQDAGRVEPIVDAGMTEPDSGTQPAAPDAVTPAGPNAGAGDVAGQTQLGCSAGGAKPLSVAVLLACFCALASRRRAASKLR